MRKKGKGGEGKGREGRRRGGQGWEAKFRGKGENGKG